ncbi:MAG: MFS transporter, partial [Parvibaculum sp.]|uniref:MFS transporter n=1 Tax=Parvibaculum sp. TaxID=2024848 RepID=UPI003C71E3B2
AMLAITLFFHQFAHFVLPSIWSFYVMEKFGWSVREIGYSLGVAGLSMAIVQGGLIRSVIPRIGAERAAYVGLVFAAIGYFGYAFSTTGWALYAFMVPAALAGLAFPSINGLISVLVPANAQGELQGALGSISGMTAIIGPVVMTQLFGYFTSAAAPVNFPGAAFFAAGLLELAAVLMLVRVIRRSAASASA